MKFKRASDAELKEAGWDPAWFVEDSYKEGPYVVSAESKFSCAHCGSTVVGFTVVNTITATAIGGMWAHYEGEVGAHEHAQMLNSVWVEGYDYANIHAAKN